MPNTLLTGFPRCGNTFALYIINFLGGMDEPQDPKNRFKVVKPNHDGPKAGRGVQNVMMVVRDYKECLPRHYGPNTINGYEGKIKKLFDGGPSNSGYRPSLYVNNLNFYNGFAGPKYLIYYEDLITDTIGETTRIFDFMINHFNEKPKPQRLKEFINNINFHILRSYNNYTDPQTNGKQIVSHANELNEKVRRSLDVFFEQSHPDIFENYLLRYRK